MEILVTLAVFMIGLLVENLINGRRQGFEDRDAICDRLARYAGQGHK